MLRLAHVDIKFSFSIDSQLTAVYRSSADLELGRANCQSEFEEGCLPPYGGIGGRFLSLLVNLLGSLLDNDLMVNACISRLDLISSFCI